MMRPGTRVRGTLAANVPRPVKPSRGRHAVDETVPEPPQLPPDRRGSQLPDQGGLLIEGEF
jgi:hypothetical protein